MVDTAGTAPYSRRAVLALGLASMVVPLAPSIAGGRNTASGGYGMAVLAGRNRTAAAAVGRAYLAIRPGEADPQVVRDLMQKHATLQGDALGGCGNLRLQALYRRAVRHDFETGRIVEIDGWVLAETEARACAIVALGEA